MRDLTALPLLALGLALTQVANVGGLKYSTGEKTYPEKIRAANQLAAPSTGKISMYLKFETGVNPSIGVPGPMILEKIGRKYHPASGVGNGQSATLQNI